MYHHVIVKYIYQSLVNGIAPFSPESYLLNIFSALSMLQNGKLPRILDVETLDELFGDSPRDVLAAVGKGMDSLGIFQVYYCFLNIFALYLYVHKIIFGKYRFCTICPCV